MTSDPAQLTDNALERLVFVERMGCRYDILVEGWFIAPGGFTFEKVDIYTSRNMIALVEDWLWEEPRRVRLHILWVDDGVVKVGSVVARDGLYLNMNWTSSIPHDDTPSGKTHALARAVLEVAARVGEEKQP